MRSVGIGVELFVGSATDTPADPFWGVLSSPISSLVLHGRDGLGETGQVDVAAGEVVAGDRSIFDGLVHIARSQRGAFGCAIHASNISCDGQIVITYGFDNDAAPCVVSAATPSPAS